MIKRAKNGLNLTNTNIKLKNQSCWHEVKMEISQLRELRVIENTMKLCDELDSELVKSDKNKGI